MWGNRHLAEGGYIFHNYTTVTVESKGTAVFIQTDKPVYKPKHRGSHEAPPPQLKNQSEREEHCLTDCFLRLSLVLINVYTVTPDLRPVNDKVIPNLKFYYLDR